MDRPNILFITTDQQRKDTVGCYGNPRIQTPHLDRLSQGGIQFNRAYAECPICIPSRITMISGRTASHHSCTLHNTSMRSDELTIGDVLGGNGYVTHFIGKPHFKSQQHPGTEESLQDWREGKMAGWSGPYAGFQTVDMILGHSNSLVGHYGEWLRQEHPDQFNVFRRQHLQALEVEDVAGVYRNDIPPELHSSSYVAMRTCEFLEKMQDAEQPFYCFASFPDPHWPIMPPQPYFDMYKDTPMPADPPWPDLSSGNYPRTYERALRRQPTWYEGGGYKMTKPEEAAAVMRAYWGAVTFIDANIGRMLAALEKFSLARNTIVIFTADHGEYMGTRGLMAKGGFVCEEFINVPFLVRYPAVVTAHRETDALLSLTDIVPTLLDLCGVDDSMPFDGVSQKDVVTGQSDGMRDSVRVMHTSYAESSDMAPDIQVLITDEWKLAYYAGDAGGELYNLREDPRESRNLYDVPEHAERQAKMTLQLLDQIILTNDRRPLIERKSAINCYSEHVMTDEVWGAEYKDLEDCGQLRCKNKQ